MFLYFILFIGSNVFAIYYFVSNYKTGTDYLLSYLINLLDWNYFYFVCSNKNLKLLKILDSSNVLFCYNALHSHFGIANRECIITNGCSSKGTVGIIRMLPMDILGHERDWMLFP